MFFKKIILLIIMFFITTINQCMAKENFYVKTEKLATNQRWCQHVLVSDDGSFRKEIGSSTGYWFNEKNKLLAIIESNMDMQYGKSTFNGEIYKVKNNQIIFITKIFKTSQQYIDNSCTAKPLYTMRQLNQKIGEDLLARYERIKNIDFTVKKISFKIFKPQNKSDILLLNFIKAAQTNNYKNTALYYGYIGGPREKSSDYEKAVKELINKFQRYKLEIIEYKREVKSEDIIYNLYFSNSDFKYIELYLDSSKNNKKFLINIFK